EARAAYWAIFGARACAKARLLPSGSLIMTTLAWLETRGGSVSMPSGGRVLICSSRSLTASVTEPAPARALSSDRFSQPPRSTLHSATCDIGVESPARPKSFSYHLAAALRSQLPGLP